MDKVLIILSVLAIIVMFALIFISARKQRKKILDMQYKKIVAIDFDGTIVEDEFPNIGAIKQETVDRMLIEKARGSVLIIWTCRGGTRLREAVKFLKTNNIPFDYVNRNPLNPLGDTTRKLYADEYWDDKAVKIQ
ncbi:MAG: hypothetical protein N4A63_16290 [Vallitalea sp.]|nr:hypothetical protein [Vallitalea sp.]